MSFLKDPYGDRDHSIPDKKTTEMSLSVPSHGGIKPILRSLETVFEAIFVPFGVRWVLVGDRLESLAHRTATA